MLKSRGYDREKCKRGLLYKFGGLNLGKSGMTHCAPEAGAGALFGVPSMAGSAAPLHMRNPQNLLGLCGQQPIISFSPWRFDDAIDAVARDPATMTSTEPSLAAPLSGPPQPNRSSTLSSEAGRAAQEAESRPKINPPTSQNVNNSTGTHSESRAEPREVRTLPRTTYPLP